MTFSTKLYPFPLSLDVVFVFGVYNGIIALSVLVHCVLVLPFQLPGVC